jgi:hypothetical protein
LNLIGISAWIVGMLGFALLVAGVAMVSVPAGLIVAGVLLLCWAYLADRAAARIALSAVSAPQEK